MNKFLLIFKELLIFLFDKWTRRRSSLEEEESLEGKLILMTGADGGIGREALKGLVQRGAKVIMGCLHKEDGEKVKEEVRRSTTKGEMFVHQLDLGDRTSIHRFAIEIALIYPELNILICNGGIGGNVANPKDLVLNSEGIELHMAINYFGHFLLTQLLLDLLKKGSPSRIIFTASTMHIFQHLKLEDSLKTCQGLPMGILGEVPYANSKWALMLFGQEFAERVEKFGVHIYSICPGLCDTPIHGSYNWSVFLIYKLLLLMMGYPAEEGAKTIIWAATSTSLAKESGKMYRFCKEYTQATRHLEREKEFGRKLYDISEKLVGLK